MSYLLSLMVITNHMYTKLEAAPIRAGDRLAL